MKIIKSDRSNNVIHEIEYERMNPDYKKYPNLDEQDSEEIESPIIIKIGLNQRINVYRDLDWDADEFPEDDVIIYDEDDLDYVSENDINEDVLYYILDNSYVNANIPAKDGIYRLMGDIDLYYEWDDELRVPAYRLNEDKTKVSNITVKMVD